MAPAEQYSSGWLYLQTSALVEQLRANAHGSVFDTITKATFEPFKITDPSFKVRTAFDKIIGSLFERMRVSDIEYKTLSKLRDTLLPKLISGELKIPDAEKFIEEAGI